MILLLTPELDFLHLLDNKREAEDAALTFLSRKTCFIPNLARGALQRQGKNAQGEQWKGEKRSRVD
jgi:hypothetical protein